MNTQTSLKYLQSLIDEVENGWVKEDIERARKLMEKIEINKDDPMTIQNENSKELVLSGNRKCQMVRQHYEIKTTT